MAVDLAYIKESFQEEDIRELIDILEGEKIIYRWKKVDGGYYSLRVNRDILDTSCVGVMITVEDSIGRYEEGLKYPTSTDSFYDSCIDVIKDLRKRKFS
ncbi:MAG: hypothetical protein ABIF18_04460 [archaeon]